MPTNTHKIDIHFINIDLYLSTSLSSISVEKYFIISTDLPNLFNILHNSNLIMDKNDTNT